jgi:hypothetical protein
LILRRSSSSKTDMSGQYKRQKSHALQMPQLKHRRDSASAAASESTDSTGEND